MISIAQNFKRFEDWLKENFSEGYDDLNPSMTNEEITQLEEVLGFKIPKDLEELLRCHNGQKEDSGFILDKFTFLSTNAIEEIYKDLVNEFEEDKFIPFAEESETYIGISLNKETFGQIFYYEGTYMEYDEDIESDSLSLFFDQFVNNVLKGNCIIDTELHILEINYIED